MATPTLVIAPDVRDALAQRRAVVALETAVVTHGLPREPLARAPKCAPSWNARAGANLALAQLMEQTVRDAGATPATVGMLRGQLIVGMSEAQVEELAAVQEPRKLSARDVGPAAVLQANGGTTVAATLAACAAAKIRVFATGGIGGVHRGWSVRPDISADLLALARTPTAVVSAGAKSVLDLAATLEVLDTLGIPVIGMGTEFFPRFTSPGDDTLRTPCTAADAAAAARMCGAHWDVNPGTGVLLANPPPAAFAMDPQEMERAVEQAQRDAMAQSIHGPALTPFLLAHIARATQGRSVEANIALLAANAQLAAKLAVELTQNIRD